MFTKVRTVKNAWAGGNELSLIVNLATQEIRAAEYTEKGHRNYYEAPFSKENAQKIIKLRRDSALEILKDFETRPAVVWVDYTDKKWNYKEFYVSIG